MKLRLLLVCVLFALNSGCGASRPNSFVQVMEPGWTSIELRESLNYEQAWQEVVDVLAKRFELEMISKDGGYVRTSWVHSWWKQGELTENYRVRAIVKFAANQEQVDVKTEANYLQDKSWVTGTDTRLLQTVKTDIMGVIGRTTR